MKILFFRIILFFCEILKTSYNLKKIHIQGQKNRNICFNTHREKTCISRARGKNEEKGCFFHKIYPELLNYHESKRFFFQ